ncbi:MAG: hypothetical protein Q9227_009077 [Pyrenula ochraceoflavens]
MASALASLTAGLTPAQLAALSDQNHDAEVYTVASIFSALAVIAVLIRVTSRHMKKVAFGLDDGLIVGVRNYGLGRHLWTLNKEQFVNFNKLWYTVGTLQCTGLFLTKISLLVLYYRIFITPGFRLATKILGVILLFWWLGTILADSLICIPVSKNWDPTISGHCGNKDLLAKIPPMVWIVTDLAVLLMPMRMVWKMHLPKIQRVGLATIFLLGGFATFASCFRFGLLFYQPADVTYNLIPATIWTIIEIDITTIAVCLIVSWPWLARIYPTKMVSAISKRLSTARKSSSHNRSPKRWQLFSSFARLDEKPPAVTAGTMGGPFSFDVENQMKTQHPDIERSVYIVGGARNDQN